MDSVSIPTTSVSSFGSVSECMGSWIHRPPPCWYRLYLTSRLWIIYSWQQGILAPTLSPWNFLQFDLWPFIKLIDVFAPLLYIPSTIELIVCACFLPVILSPCPSNPSIWSAWNFNFGLLLLYPWMKLWHPCHTALLYCLSLCL